MQAVLLFLAAAAVLGSWGHKESSRIPKGLLFALSVILAFALYSRRVV